MRNQHHAAWLLPTLLALWVHSAWAQTPGINQDKPGGPVTLNFMNADIEAVSRAMGSITGKQVVVDPRVKGTVSLSTDQPVNSATAYNQFLTVLRLQGFAVVESGGLLKVVPEADAKLQTGVVAAAPGTSQILTQVFKLNHENAANLVPVLRPLISPNNTINHNPGNNSLVITDYADNLQRMARIINAMDVANGSDVEIVPLKHAIASDLAVLVTRLLDPATAGAPAPGGADATFKTTVLPEPRANALIIRAANPARVALVKSLIDKLDQPTAGGTASGNINVVYLKNADATKLAATLRGILTGQVSNPGSNPGLSGMQPGALAPINAAAPGSSFNTSTPAAQPGGQVQADPSTNSLIITAPEPQYRQLRAVIDKLDARRAQVFVESLIAEVNSDRAAEIGIQWQGPIGKAGDATVGLLGTNFGTGARNIFNLSQGTTAPAPGLNVGAAQNINGVYVLGFLGRLLEQNGDGNVLSTPNLLTLDNEEAKIVVGQNVPFLTGQYTNANVGGTGAVNPFQTIERKDVGLTLRVKPQVSENGTVKLQIFQEVSSVDPASLASPSGITTNKRSIESNVLVQDGSVVVLGGLLQDQYSGDQSRVPGLADIPIFGNLFKSETRGRKKTNLMVFLRPVVLRDADSLENLSMDRYTQMRGAQQGAQPQPNQIFPINSAPVLPAAEGRAPASASTAPAATNTPAR